MFESQSIRCGGTEDSCVTTTSRRPRGREVIIEVVANFGAMRAMFDSTMRGEPKLRRTVRSIGPVFVWRMVSPMCRDTTGSSSTAAAAPHRASLSA